MDVHERLEEFYRRLAAAEPAATAEAALELVCRLIEEVEDELCPLPREFPPPVVFSGRMYAPQRDRMKRTVDGSIVATARRHRISCARDGAIEISLVQGNATVFYKEALTP